MESEISKDETSNDAETSSPSILVVDDEKLNLKLTEACLSREGMTVRGALDATEAMERIGEELPDIILLDIMMPGVNGIELCRRLKADRKTRAVPIIMVTALSDAKSRIQALEAGADDFITKPIDMFEMVVRVKSLYRIKTYHDQLAGSLETIEKKNKELLDLEQVKQALIHMIVHDMRSPLSNIFGKLQLIQLEAGLENTHRNDVTDCVSMCMSLNRMIEGLLDIHRMDQGALQPNFSDDADPVHIVREAAATFDSFCRNKSVEMDISAVDPLPHVAFDPDLFLRIIINILENAVRVTPAGKSVSVTVMGLQDSRGLQFVIQDDGPGIPEAFHQAIFDRFKQVDLKKQGVRTGASGLGLAFCKMAVEAHGGVIRVENRKTSNGCRFIIELPLREDPKEKAEP